MSETFSKIILTNSNVEGYTSSPHRMVISDTKEELVDYINDNQLIDNFDENL